MRGLVLASGAAVLLACATGLAATIHVPSDEPTIQAGVAAAADGDTVVVAAGVYQESISMLGKRITLRSEVGAASTAIRAIGFDHAIVCLGGEDEDTRIEGFTLRDASVGGIECFTGTSPVLSRLVLAGNDGNGARCTHSSPTFRHCEAYGNGAPGIYCNGATVLVDSCSFTAPGESGLKAWNYSDVSIHDCSFVGTCPLSGERSGDTGIYIRSSALTMVGCTLEGFSGYSALTMFHTADVTIETSVFRANSAGFGGAIDAVGGAQSNTPLLVSECVFEENSASDNGGACALRACSSALFKDCLFVGNETAGVGGAVSSDDVGQTTYVDCEFLGNNAVDDGGGVHSYGSSEFLLAVSGCLFEGDTAGNSGGAISVSSCGGTIEHCTIYGCSSGGNAGALHFGGSPTPDVTACIVSDCAGTGMGTQDEVVLPFVSYCDVWNCTHGNYGGLFPDLTGSFGNISEDPQFCDAPARDFSLYDSSPCAGSGPGGSDMGAFGVACGGTAVERTSWGAIKAGFR